MSEHKYQCGKCKVIFSEPTGYECDPSKRKCIKCGGAKGEISYLGCGKAAALYIINDTLGYGVQGVLNPVDGKKYDSKAAYHRKLKESGHHVYEGKPNPNKALNRGDHNVFKELKQAAIQHGL